MSEALRLFYSYSHRDEAFRTELEIHLSILKRQGIIAEWHDRKIVPGQEWRQSISSFLEESDIILLLVSPAFVASDYCWDMEMLRALERHKAGEAVVVPVIIRPVDFHGAPFAELQMLPKDATAVTTWDNQDEAWLDVTRGIRRVCDRLQEARAKRAKNAYTGVRDIKKEFQPLHVSERPAPAPPQVDSTVDWVAGWRCRLDTRCRYVLEAVFQPSGPQQELEVVVYQPEPSPPHPPGAWERFVSIRSLDEPAREILPFDKRCFITGWIKEVSAGSVPWFPLIPLTYDVGRETVSFTFGLSESSQPESNIRLLVRRIDE